MSNEIVEIDALLSSKDRFLSDASVGGSNDMYLFNDWKCQDRTLRKRAKNLINKLGFLVNEVLISDEDYVYFENEIIDGVDTNHIFIIRLNENKRVVVGGFSFSNSKYKGSQAVIWNGKDTNSSLKNNMQFFESWAELKKLLTKDVRLRALVRESFIHAS